MASSPARPCPSGAEGRVYPRGALVLPGKMRTSGGGHRGGRSQVSKTGDTVFDRQAQGTQGPTLRKALPTGHREITCKVPSLHAHLGVRLGLARSPHGVRPPLPGPQPLLPLGRRPSPGAVHLRRVSPGPIPQSRPACTAGKSSNSPRAQPSTLGAHCHSATPLTFLFVEF